MIILQAKNIKKSYETVVLKDINLDIKKGESIAILGASGSGKTTLLNILASLEKKDFGDIYLEGVKNFSDLAYVRNRFFGFIFQNHNLLEDLTVIENLLIPQKIAKKNKSISNKIASDLLVEVDLIDKKDMLTRNLSGGEKQRVAAIRAFCNDPKIIVADEPTGNLDKKNSKKLQTLLFDFIKKKEKSLVVATHDLEFASFFDKTYLLEDGILKKTDLNGRRK